MPTAETLAAWLLGSPEALPLAVAVAEAAWLTPADAWTDRERWAHRAAERWLRDFAPVLPGNRTPSAPVPFAVLFLSDLVIASEAAGRPRAPLFALIDAWPVPTDHETRADRRIMPALRVVGPSTERERGRLMFGGLLDGRPREAALILFPEHEPQRYEVPLLEIAERAGLPFRSRGKGAPVESRLGGARRTAEPAPGGSRAPGGAHCGDGGRTTGRAVAAVRRARPAPRRRELAEAAARAAPRP